MTKDHFLDAGGGGSNIAVELPHVFAQCIDAAFMQVVLRAQRKGVHFELACQHVHHALDGQMYFLVAVAAESAYRGGVGVHRIAGQLAVIEFIRPGRVVGGCHGDVDACVGIGAAGMQHFDLQRDQLAVLLGANLHLRADAVADQRAGEIFLA